MTTAIQKPQHLQALDQANARRFGYCDLKRELKAGELTLEQAIDDPRSAGPLTISKLLAAKNRVGPKRAGRFLFWVRIPESTRVENLSPSQRRKLLEYVARRDHVAARELARKRKRLYAQTNVKDQQRASANAA